MHHSILDQRARERIQALIDEADNRRLAAGSKARTAPDAATPRPATGGRPATAPIGHRPARRLVGLFRQLRGGPGLRTGLQFRPGPARTPDCPPA